MSASLIYPPYIGPGTFDLATQGGTQNDIAVTSEAGVVRIANSANLGLVAFTSATPLIASTTDGASFATAAFTPTGSTEYLIFVGPSKATTPDEPSAFTAANFSTPQRLITVVNAAGTGRVSVYRCRSIASPTSLALTVTFPASQTGCFISVVKVTGDNGSAYQLASTLASGVTAAASPLALSSLGANAKTIGAALQVATATAPTLPAGYTDMHNGTIATPSTGWRTQTKNAPDDTFSFTGTGTADLVGVVVGVGPGNTATLITGFAGGYAGRRITVKNDSIPDTGNYRALYDTLVFQNNDAGSIDGNRIYTPRAAGLFLPPGASVDLVYDGVSTHWLIEETYDTVMDFGSINVGRTHIVRGVALEVRGTDVLHANALVSVRNSGIASPTQADVIGGGRIDLGDGISSVGGSPASAYLYYNGDGILGTGPSLLVDGSLYFGKISGGAAIATEGATKWDDTLRTLTIGDGVQAKPATAAGWQPYAYPEGMWAAAASVTGLALAISGGTVLIPFWLRAPMKLQAIAFRNVDTSGAHTLEGRIYVDRQNNSNSLDFVTGTDVTFSFTPSAGDIREAAVSGAPVTLAPGIYWLALRNTSVSVVANIAREGASGNSLWRSGCQTKTIGLALAATLDAVAATWTKVDASVHARLNGRVFGQSVGFI